MSETIRFDDMSADELAAYLTANGVLSMEQAEALKRFVERVGGLENAHRAVEMLRELEDAA